jgi:hypothetical protein
MILDPACCSHKNVNTSTKLLNLLINVGTSVYSQDVVLILSMFK